MRLTSYLAELAGAWLEPLGFTLASPRDAARRGAHICLRHPEAWRISQALIQAGVIGDYRTPGRLRLGAAPVTTRYTDIWDAAAAIRQITEDKTYLAHPSEPARVT
jgi:kynureninase